MSRDTRIDTVRGGLLVMMAINHIDSDLRVLTDQAIGFVSAAEGFIFLAGLVAGQVYTRRYREGGAPELYGRCARRAGELYLWHVALLVFTLVWGRLAVNFLSGHPWRLPPLFFENPVVGLLSGLTLLYQPGLLDILPNYVGFLLLTPWALTQCRQGRVGRVWLLSGCIWAFDQLFLPSGPFLSGPINTGAFHFLSWQWLYVSGLVVGYTRETTGRLMDNPRRGFIAAGVMVAAFLWTVRSPWLPNWWSPQQLIRLTDKTSIGFLRIANFAVVAFLLGAVASRYPRWFTFRPLAFLGRYTLAAFASHVAAAMMILTWPETFDSTAWRWADTALMITSLFVGAGVAAWVRARKSDRGSAPAPALGAG